MEYKVFKQKAFDTPEKIEKRLNELAREGWRVVTSMSSGVYLILAKER